MTDYRENLEKELKELGKTKAQLARETGIDYKRISGFFCRYWFLSIEDEKNVRSVLSQWQRTRNQNVSEPESAKK
jgi:hypothetical protein